MPLCLPPPPNPFDYLTELRRHARAVRAFPDPLRQPQHSIASLNEMSLIDGDACGPVRNS